uniref:Uncharacterized protein n=1 Tax=Glossina pallidipes TaxID=7398 RepID=A0A1A9ZET9_GLOPL
MTTDIHSGMQFKIRTLVMCNSITKWKPDIQIKPYLTSLKKIRLILVLRDLINLIVSYCQQFSSVHIAQQSQPHKTHLIAIPHAEKVMLIAILRPEELKNEKAIVCTISISIQKR